MTESTLRRLALRTRSALFDGRIGGLVAKAAFQASSPFLRHFTLPARFHRAAAAFFACARRCAFVSPFHFAREALLADALRCSGVRLRLRALPPWLANQRAYSATDLGGRATSREYKD